VHNQIVILTLIQVNIQLRCVHDLKSILTHFLWVFFAVCVADVDRLADNWRQVKVVPPKHIVIVVFLADLPHQD
jgi:hypothetical protein